MTIFFVRELHSKQPAKSRLGKTGQMAELHKMEKREERKQENLQIKRYLRDGTNCTVLTLLESQSKQMKSKKCITQPRKCEH